MKTKMKNKMIVKENEKKKNVYLCLLAFNKNNENLNISFQPFLQHNFAPVDGSIVSYV